MTGGLSPWVFEESEQFRLKAEREELSNAS